MDKGKVLLKDSHHFNKGNVHFQCQFAIRPPLMLSSDFNRSYVCQLSEQSCIHKQPPSNESSQGFRKPHRKLDFSSLM